MNHGDVLDSAIDRVLEVAVGALTGLLVSFLVLPSRAHSQVRANAARVLELMASALDELLSGLTRGRDNDTLHRLQDGIGAALAGLNATGAEAERERAARLSSGSDTGPLLRTVLRLRHDLVMIGRATVVPLPERIAAAAGLAPGAGQRRFRRLSQGGRGGAADRQASAGDLPVQAALQHYAAEVAAVRSEGLTRGVPGEVAERFFALGFSLEQMQQNLKDLERCVTAWADSPPVSSKQTAEDPDLTG